ncbi:MAG: hypothetical protein ACOC5A_03265, partial [Halanaerobiales bacterium]
SDDIRSTLPLQFNEKIYRYIYDHNTSFTEFWREKMVLPGSWLPEVYIQRGENRKHRISIPVNYTLREKYLKDWWLEFIGKRGKREKISAEKIKKIEESNINYQKQKGRYIFAPHQVDLILEFESSGKQFGLEALKPVQPEVFAKKDMYSLKKYLYEVVPGTGLYCWQMEGGENHE